MATNTDIGKDFILSASQDAGLTYLPIAGIRTKGITRENPIADVTNQADAANNETSAAYTGYGTVTINGSGVVDTRVAGLFPFAELQVLANSVDPLLDTQLMDAGLTSYTGNFLITSFETTAEENGVVEFTIALQNEGPVAFASGA